MGPSLKGRWFEKASEIAARVRSPIGARFKAASAGGKATLYLYDQIGRDFWTGEGTTAQDVVKALAEARGATDLEVRINSPGGDVFEGIAIFNAIRAFNGTRTVVVDGIAASIASVIALAGDKVRTAEGAMWMVHNPWAGVFAVGTADEIEAAASKTVGALRAVRDNLIDIYVSNTGRKRDEIDEWMTAETWMSAAESVERGFSDEMDAPADPEDPDSDEEEVKEQKPPAAVTVTTFDQPVAWAYAMRRAAETSGASPGAAPPGQPVDPDISTKEK
jgi:ATP-dependent Clp protease, protease subunit